MSRSNIYTTRAVAAFLPPSQLNELVSVLRSNRAYILTTAQSQSFWKIWLSHRSVISDCVAGLVSANQTSKFSLIRLPSKTTPIKEVIDFQFVPIDLMQIYDITKESSAIVSAIPELSNQLVINVTDITRASGELADAPQFFNRVVLAFLSRSYYASGGSMWVSPALVRYVAKVYSMTLAGNLARAFGLSPLFQMFVQTIFCAYFVAKMTSVEATPSFMMAHQKALLLPDANDLTQIFAFMKEKISKTAPDTLDDALNVIHAYGHDALQDAKGNPKLTRPVLNTRFASLHPDTHLSVIALEYPPYFLYLIMQVLSQVRVGLSFTMKSQNLLNEGKDLMDQLMRTSSFFQLP